ncbi:hypothetical protein DL546_005942 [Coniochaeta pulveracea]|uniref:Enoyl-CoA hydratase n=1 Tax=Coniochaeta pulveracea TaxID=177199 RepID=A0A420Y9M5_9PEZI|nr:hypothetical protein DL546_005942 [Coniochaeta pulveracea]
MAHPASYEILSLPDIRLFHNPPSSASPTPIITISLHRPSARNSFTEQMGQSLISAFNLLSTDPRVRVIILTSSDPTNTVFCAGMDLNAIPSTRSSFASDTRQTHRDMGGRVALAIYNCQKPVIAALNGSAVGVGIAMTLAASIRVASEGAKVGFVFARRGIVMEACSSFFLPRLIGAGKAMHLVTTGGVYPATHPLVRDLFGEIVPAEEVLKRALEIAQEVCQHCSGVSVALMKDMIFRGGGSPEEAHALESKVLYDMFRAKDFKEGVESFKQKRAPRFEATLEEDGPKVWPWWGWMTVPLGKM